MHYLSHCPHDVSLRDDICLSCIEPFPGNPDHLVCQHCGVSGNLEWADGHGQRCAGLHSQSKVEVSGDDAIPF